jgi:hypothetical protein
MNIYCLLHEHQFWFFSASLKKSKREATLLPLILQGQHSTIGTQLGFSQINLHFVFGSWFVHFQSHFGYRKQLHILVLVLDNE